MWPLRIENPIFLQNIYGHYPDLSAVEVTSMAMERDGPSIHLGFISTVLPYRPPAKWGEFNAVSFHLHFFDVRSVSVRQFSSDGMSALRMWDEDGTILLTCEGAVRMSLKCQFLRIAGISGILEKRRSGRLR